MVKSRKSWLEKLQDSKDLPRVEPISEKMSTRWGTGTIVIPAPLEVDALMRLVPDGRLTTVNQIREALAKKHGATIGCPICTGIFVCLAARAADEQAFGGGKEITPFWRTLKSNGELNEKYPGGVNGQAIRLQEEGHTIILGSGRKPPRVKDFEKALVKL
jgi:hypothetical protein